VIWKSSGCKLVSAVRSFQATVSFELQIQHAEAIPVRPLLDITIRFYASLRSARIKRRQVMTAAEAAPV
jgi:hypothetical protein